MSDSLFTDAPVTEPAVLSVEQLNRQIKQLIEGDLGLVWVQGEISNFKAHTSGHHYFSLKDSRSQISAVMFRGHNSRLKFKPTDGLEVIVRGRVSVYEPRGSYQIVCETMEPVGAGALQKAFEQLKAKLKAEGLFDLQKKRTLPPFPRRIAIVTSPTGAAIRDMLHILNRRNRSAEVILIPTVVQGETAAPKIIEALDTAYRLKNVDVVIVGRGGGSIEDMWCFNDEALARAIARSPVPTISAVGHEIDFTIADFVADVRAPTPSAAAELVVKNTEDLLGRIQSFEKLMQVAINRFLHIEKHKLTAAMSRLVDPKRKLQDLIMRADELTLRLTQGVLSYFKNQKLQISTLRASLKSPQQVISEKSTRLAIAKAQLQNQTLRSVDLYSHRISSAMSLLDSLSPLKVVDRGYSVAQKKGRVIKSVRDVEVGDEIKIRLAQGHILAQVQKKIEE